VPTTIYETPKSFNPWSSNIDVAEYL
jgi:hypothetical protein